MPGRPELLVSGLAAEDAAGLLNALAQRDDESPLEPGQMLRLGERLVQLIAAHPEQLVSAIVTFTKIEVLQVVFLQEDGMEQRLYPIESFGPGTDPVRRGVKMTRPGWPDGDVPEPIADILTEIEGPQDEEDA